MASTDLKPRLAAFRVSWLRCALLTRFVRPLSCFFAIILLAIAIAPDDTIAAEKLSDESMRLLDALGANSVPLPTLEGGFKEFSLETKNELVGFLAHQKKVKASGKALARLPFILTSQNKADMRTVFARGLDSPAADERTAALYGLQRLEDSRLARYAERLLQDNSDDVLVAVFTILIPQAKQDSKLWTKMHRVYIRHKDEPGFYTSNALLVAHGLANPSPPPPSKP